MKKSTLAFFCAVIATSVSVVESCSAKKDNPTPTSNTEFIADSNSFISYMNWSLDKSFKGPDPLLGAMAHANNDSTVVREVHFKDGQNPVNSKYPVGTLILKHSHNPTGTVNEFTGMVKRGNNFNPTKGDWEFFMLTASGKIATDSTGMPMRGANLMSGMCGSCHSSASSKDFVFSK